MTGYQKFELIPAIIPRSVTTPEVDCSLQPPEAYQILNLNSTISFDTSIPASPSNSDSQEAQSSVTNDVESKKHKLHTTKRRMQNRDAQRRFRGRKEERHQILEQRATELEAKCQRLSEGFEQKSKEVSKIIKEKEALATEMQDLRKRWNLMLMLLRRPNRLQSLSSLLGSDSSSTSGSSLSSSSSPSSIKAEPMLPLEDLLGCLQELLLPNEMPHGSSPLC
ncbi:bZIP transcription factor bZIP-1 [Penicillium cataractarum]|uniref:BZIP transcription factor bZIP-1 n=1 Tax=Penicillium cataractarum TaxID=2100454 RepID=A0A9W9R7P4_9EURO|nr:bZIP transcription factor bZIP-1 [Penicillium cataractarum]KAJ5355126.1 bZIP transcription factor bZIP-1 [Penicillium cataractarum]